MRIHKKYIIKRGKYRVKTRLPTTRQIQYVPVSVEQPIPSTSRPIGSSSLTPKPISYYNLSFPSRFLQSRKRDAIYPPEITRHLPKPEPVYEGEDIVVPYYNPRGRVSRLEYKYPKSGLRVAVVGNRLYIQLDSKTVERIIQTRAKKLSSIEEQMTRLVSLFLFYNTVIGRIYNIQNKLRITIDEEIRKQLMSVLEKNIFNEQYTRNLILDSGLDTYLQKVIQKGLNENFYIQMENQDPESIWYIIYMGLQNMIQYLKLDKKSIRDVLLPVADALLTRYGLTPIDIQDLYRVDPKGLEERYPYVAQYVLKPVFVENT